MIGARFLYRIDHRLRAIFARPDFFFGGLSILFCGDFGQLPPVADTILYSNPKTSTMETLGGLLAYRAFTETIVLTRIMRQQGETAIARQFRDCLSQVRDGPISINNWRFLLSRSRSNVNHKTWRTFDDALRLYARNDCTTRFNLARLRDLDKPVMKINATHSGKGAKDGSSDDAGRLEKTLLLSKGSRVMLTRNLWTTEGLVNGAMGTVLDLLWNEGVDDAFAVMPAVVLVVMDRYTGAGSLELDGGVHVVPIIPKTNQWDNNGVVCSRTQFPLVAAFAITIHKSQGLTLPLVVLDFQIKDDCSGQSYVALSRVKDIEHVVFETDFSYDRFPSKISDTVRNRLLDSKNRQAKTSHDHLPEPIPVGSAESIEPIELFEHLTSAEAILRCSASQVAEVAGVAIDVVSNLYDQLITHDEIALVIGQYPLLHREDETLVHAKICSRFDVHYDINLWVLSTFLDTEWLCSSAVNGVISRLAELTTGIQLMSSTMTFLTLQKLNQNRPVSSEDVLQLNPFVDTIVFPVNLSGRHWCVAQAQCRENRRMIVVYNSLPRCDEVILKEQLPLLLDCIIQHNPSSLWAQSRWIEEKMVNEPSIIQQDGHNCGVYTIYNALQLTRRQKPCTESVDPKRLRLQYAAAMVKEPELE